MPLHSTAERFAERRRRALDAMAARGPGRAPDLQAGDEPQNSADVSGLGRSRKRGGSGFEVVQTSCRPGGDRALPDQGNINANGERIYHTPWARSGMTETKISLDQGERWFCSERETLDAGWQAPLR
jgi:hypothetical protein